MRQTLSFLVIGGLIFALFASFLAPPSAQAQTNTILEEVMGERTQHSKVFRDLLNPGTFHLEASISPLHYESVPGSGVFDTEIDFRPERVVNATFDGWVVEQAGWWYRLGNHTQEGTDGWVGFGGRGGQHWLDFRFTDLAYVHYPTRSLDILNGGTPDYDRANLARTSPTTPIGNADLNLGLEATWADIFTTPGGGSLSLEWLVGGLGLKENIRINEEALTWLRNNRPPSTPLAETYLGAMFQVNLSAIPFLVKESQTINPNSDFDDADGNPLELRDARGRFLGLLPIEQATTEDPQGETLGSTQLRKRMWLNATTGLNQLLVGARLDHLNALPSGDLVYDPSIQAQVGAGGDDCDTEQNNPGLDCGATFMDVPGNDPGEGDVGNTSFMFRGINIPQGSIITSANFTPFLDVDGDDGLGFRSHIFLEADDNATVPISEANYDAKNTTGNFTHWNDTVGSTAFETSPDIGPVVQEVINRTGWVNGSNLQILWKYVPGQGLGTNVEVRTYDDSPARGALLDVAFTAPPPGPPGNGNGPIFPPIGADETAFLFQIILIGGLVFPFFLWMGWRVKNGGPEILAGISLVILSFRIGEFLGDFVLALLFLGAGLLLGVYGVFVFYQKRKGR